MDGLKSRAYSSEHAIGSAVCRRNPSRTRPFLHHASGAGPFHYSKKEASMSRLLKASLAAAALIPAAVMAMGGASGPKTTYEVQGHLGEIVVNPYEVAPLTAIIRNGGYQILDARVTVLPKPEGEEIWGFRGKSWYGIARQPRI